MSYQEYPKHMSHPAFRPAVVVKWDPKIKDPKDQKQGSPTRFPPVIVHNLDQEQQYAALGYRPNGVSDPEAYRKAMTGNMPRPDGSEKQYPKYLHRPDASKQEGFSSTLVHTKEEEAKLGKGWYKTPGDALKAGSLPKEEPDSPVQASSPEAPVEAAPAQAAAEGKTRLKRAKRPTAKKGA